MWQTQGIILAFNAWPDGEEGVLISKELEALGLEKTEELPVTRVWFLKYTDNEPRNVIEAHSICRNLTEKYSLKYCRPERIPREDRAQREVNDAAPRQWRRARMLASASPGLR